MSRIIHCGRREFKHSKIGRRRPTNVPRLRRMRGHGKEAVLTNGPLHLQGVPPSVANLFLLISLSAQIQRKRVLSGENLTSSTPALTSSSRRLRFHVQLTSHSNCHQSSRRCASIGLCDPSVFVEMTKIHGYIVHTAT